MSREHIKNRKKANSSNLHIGKFAVVVGLIFCQTGGFSVFISVTLRFEKTSGRETILSMLSEVPSDCYHL